jgi:DNA-binding NarL/FixJ family response regulator
MLTILVVEDSPFFRRTFVESLEHEFPEIEILETENGSEALRIVDESRPFLVFTDIRLPGENGIELTRKIKADHPEIAVAILTSYDSVEYRDAARKTGASEFFPKDAVSMQGILRVVHSILAERTSGSPIFDGTS